MNDLHGQAILDYYKGDHEACLILHNSYGEPEEMPVEVFFREPEDFSELENLAISNCRGKILDLGAGAGAHSLFLQSLDFDVTALDNSPGCKATLEKSGIKKVVCEDFQKHHSKYDTLLLLMNGLGLAGKFENVSDFLNACFELLKPDGQILVDSSDISYLYEDGLQKPAGYFGEIRYRYEYKNQLGDWFDWVYVDPNSLEKIAIEMGLHFELVIQEENDQFLARISKVPYV